jgi:hypothetical protein
VGNAEMMLDSLLYWSDSEVLYRIISFGLLALLAILVIWPAATNKTGRMGAAFFVLVLCAFVILARWPGLFYPRGFNPDEDQFVAAARALVLDPVFFRATEAGSSGPLNVYPLLASLLAGVWPTLFSARLVGLAMICGALVAVYCAGRAVFSEPVARFGALLPGVFFGLTNYWDFTHYTSEHMPMAILAWGAAMSLWALARPEMTFSRRVAVACLAACLFSLVPFAKLQAAMAAVVYSGILVAGVALYGSCWRQKVGGIAIVCVAGILLPIALMVFFVFNGVFDYFWKSYILNALAYQGSGYQGQSAWQMLGMILFAFPPNHPIDFLWFSTGWLALMCLGGAALLCFRRRSVPWRVWGVFAYMVLVIGLAIWTVTAPQRNYPHYLLFLPIPMGMFSMALLGLIDEKLVQRGATSRLVLIVLAVIGALGPMLVWRTMSPNSWAGLAQNWSKEEKGLIAKKLLEVSQGEGRLCVWGYNPTLYTETGLLQATRLSTSSGLFNDNALRSFFLATYIDDLQRNRPLVFVDAVAPDQFVMMTKREEHGHEKIPEIRDFVAANYTLFEEIDGVRIYKWKEGQP